MQMKKREFLAMSAWSLAGLAISANQANAMSTKRTVSAGGVTFSWHHDAGQLVGNLTAPTSGWIAVGFNRDTSLKGTRFIIAALSILPIRVEEHIALVPQHQEVSTLGLAPAVLSPGGNYQNGLSQLTFALPQVIEGSLDLGAGTQSYLMLAWSNETDFDHHSAWRRHFSITL